MNLNANNFFRHESTIILQDGTKDALISYGYESKKKIYAIRMVSPSNYELSVNCSPSQSIELPYFRAIIKHFNLNLTI